MMLHENRCSEFIGVGVEKRKDEIKLCLKTIYEQNCLNN